MLNYSIDNVREINNNPDNYHGLEEWWNHYVIASKKVEWSMIMMKRFTSDINGVFSITN